jgi:hypothetical protein
VPAFLPVGMPKYQLIFCFFQLRTHGSLLSGYLPSMFRVGLLPD